MRAGGRVPWSVSIAVATMNATPRTEGDEAEPAEVRDLGAGADAGRDAA